MSRNLKGGLAAAMALALLAVLPAVAGDGGDNVVVTKPGVVFHKAGSSDIRGRAVDKTVDAALEAGYAPCPVCFAKELAAAKATTGPNSGGAAVAVSGGEGLPSPPVSTVTQPFGVRYASRPQAQSRDSGIRDPYADSYTFISGRSEQGAYGDR
ncbi:MAG TPA: hypothetical protein VJV75_12965 [Candidatus Polarisedimenticolia bacterium]|nr:hypothetical protein [Candidatus Polarisedimenticolia bacterium]